VKYHIVAANHSIGCDEAHRRVVFEVEQFRRRVAAAKCAVSNCRFQTEGKNSLRAGLRICSSGFAFIRDDISSVHYAKIDRFVVIRLANIIGAGIFCLQFAVTSNAGALG
jgi:hypothetical protein